MERSQLSIDVEKDVRKMGYESCDEERGPLQWYLLLKRVQEEEMRDEKDDKSEVKK